MNNSNDESKSKIFFAVFIAICLVAQTSAAFVSFAGQDIRSQVGCFDLTASSSINLAADGSGNGIGATSFDTRSTVLIATGVDEVGQVVLDAVFDDADGLRKEWSESWDFENYSWQYAGGGRWTKDFSVVSRVGGEDATWLLKRTRADGLPDFEIQVSGFAPPDPNAVTAGNGSRPLLPRIVFRSSAVDLLQAIGNKFYLNGVVASGVTGEATSPIIDMNNPRLVPSSEMMLRRKISRNWAQNGWSQSEAFVVVDVDGNQLETMGEASERYVRIDMSECERANRLWSEEHDGWNEVRNNYRRRLDQRYGFQVRQPESFPTLDAQIRDLVNTWTAQGGIPKDSEDQMAHWLDLYFY